ncbi:MAG: hypothetical protein U5L45_01875 [Saprospiraceae bacterium]|nr:hypothetical protein [Saprospiraceae bacterium]
MIGQNAEFEALQRQNMQLFAGWQTQVLPKLSGFDKDDLPKLLIAELAESLLNTFRKDVACNVSTHTDQISITHKLS